MTEVPLKQETNIPEEELLEMKNKLETLERKYDILKSQTIIHALFVDTRKIVNTHKDLSKSDQKLRFDATYDGKSVVIQIEECVTNNTDDFKGVNLKDGFRIITAEKDTKKVISDVSASRKHGASEWEAQIGKPKNNVEMTLGGSNSGYNWYKASGLFEKTFGRNKVLVDKITLEGDIKNGLLPEIFKTATMMKDLASKIPSQ